MLKRYLVAGMFLILGTGCLPITVNRMYDFTIDCSPNYSLTVSVESVAVQEAECSEDGISTQFHFDDPIHQMFVQVTNDHEALIFASDESGEVDCEWSDDNTWTCYGNSRMFTVEIGPPSTPDATPTAPPSNLPSGLEVQG